MRLERVDGRDAVPGLRTWEYRDRIRRERHPVARPTQFDVPGAIVDGSCRIRLTAGTCAYAFYAASRVALAYHGRFKGEFGGGENAGCSRLRTSGTEGCDLWSDVVEVGSSRRYKHGLACKKLNRLGHCYRGVSTTVAANRRNNHGVHAQVQGGKFEPPKHHRGTKRANWRIAGAWIARLRVGDVEEAEGIGQGRILQVPGPGRQHQALLSQGQSRNLHWSKIVVEFWDVTGPAGAAVAPERCCHEGREAVVDLLVVLTHRFGLTDALSSRSCCPTIVSAGHMQEVRTLQSRGSL